MTVLVCNGLPSITLVSASRWQNSPDTLKYINDTLFCHRAANLKYRRGQGDSLKLFHKRLPPPRSLPEDAAPPSPTISPTDHPSAFSSGLPTVSPKRIPSKIGDRSGVVRRAGQRDGCLIRRYCAPAAALFPPAIIPFAPRQLISSAAGSAFRPKMNFYNPRHR